MFRARRIRRDVGQVDVRLRRRREFDLRLFGRLLEALEGKLVLLEVDAVLFLEFVGEIFDEAIVEVLAAEERVAVGRFHLEDTIADLEHRHVERAAAEVVDRDRAGTLLVEAIGEGRRRRLVDDAQHFEAGDLAGILRRLALGVVEIGRHCDDGLRDGLAEMSLRRLLHLLQREGGNLRGRILLAVRRHPGVAVAGLDDLIGDEADVLLGHRIVERPADQALDREKGAFRVGDALPLGGLADQAFAVVRERDDRRRGPRAFRVLDDLRRRAFHDGNAGIGRAEIDTDNFGHKCSSFLVARPPGPEAARLMGGRVSFARSPMDVRLVSALGSARLGSARPAVYRWARDGRNGQNAARYRRDDLR